MGSRYPIIILVFILSVQCMSPDRQGRAEPGQKMNLLFIMTDEQRFDALSKAGNSVLETPNYMILKDGWKLMLPFSKTSTVINAMYNLKKDPHEMKNLLGKNPDRSDYAEKAEELKECLLE